MKTLVGRFSKRLRASHGLSLMIQALAGIYGNLEKRMLEALARLFAQNVRIYAYPMSSTGLRERLKDISASRSESNNTNGIVSANQLGARGLLVTCSPTFSPATLLSPCKFPQP